VKAIIINSGLGLRMGRHTQDTPKCLLQLPENETILRRQLRLLRNQGITRIILTTGPFEEHLKHEAAFHFPELNVLWVHNGLYATTNYIYSLFLIPQEYLDDDVIFIHGDLVFEEQVLQQLIESPHHNAVLVNACAPLPDKDFKGRVVQNQVQKISIHLFGENCFPLMPLYKFSQSAFLAWMAAIRRFVEQGKVTVYAEDALNTIFHQLPLAALYFETELCMEIDTVADLKKARTLLQENEA